MAFGRLDLGLQREPLFFWLAYWVISNLDLKNEDELATGLDEFRIRLDT